MSNRFRREELRAKRDEATGCVELETPRDIDADLPYPGIGTVLLRLVWLPAFEPCLMWEVRSHNGTLKAYRSLGRAAGEPLVVGHQQLDLDDCLLRSALDRVAAISLSFTPALADVGVVDGDAYVATVFSGFGTSSRISWIDGADPATWSPVVNAFIAFRSVLEGSVVAPDVSTFRSEVAHVYCQASSVQLVRVSTDDFRVLSPGAFGSLLCGPDHILAVAAVAEALRAACGADVVLRNTRIFRSATGESWSSYVEVIPVTELKGPDDLPHARLSATQVWHYRRGHLFVNAEVRRVLLSLSLADISFTPGFSQFAGHQAY